MIDPEVQKKQRNTVRWRMRREKLARYLGVGQGHPKRHVTEVERGEVNTCELAWQAPEQGRRIV